MITELASLKMQIIPKSALLSSGKNFFLQNIQIDCNCTSGMVAALDLCLAFVECDSTAKVHELQEVNHDCVKCRVMASVVLSALR